MTSGNTPGGTFDSDSLTPWLAKSWADALKSVAESMVEVTPALTWRTVDDAALVEPSGAWSWWSFGFDILSQTAVWVGATRESWGALGRFLLAKLGVDDPNGDDIQATCQDFIAQCAAVLARTLAAQYATDVMSGGIKPAEVPPPARQVEFVMSSPDATIRVAIHDGLVRHLLDLQPRSGTKASRDSGAEPWLPGNLEFKVKATFGRTTMFLADVLKLAVGSVIETGQRITEPVDVFCQDTLIAKGQVVLRGGNYAIRIVSVQRPNNKCRSGN